MASYLIDITEPIQIPAVTIETRNRGRNESLYTLLRHTEAPNIVRADHEMLNAPDGVEVVRRPDGGNSWYHSPASRCLTWAAPEEREYEMQRTWNKKVKDLFRRFYPDLGPLTYRGGDIDVGDFQLIGSSALVKPKLGAKLHRACWYEDDPMNDIRPLLSADGVDPREFRKKFTIAPKGFFDYLAKELYAEPVKVEDYVSEKSFMEAVELQKKEKTHLPRTCIGNFRTRDFASLNL